MSNFSFLSPDWPVLNELGELAERNLYIDPNTSLIKLRMFSEVLVKYLLAYEKIAEPVDGAQISRINVLGNSGIIPDRLLPLFIHCGRSATRQRMRSSARLNQHRPICNLLQLRSLVQANVRQC